MNFSSASRGCARAESASPRRAVLSAWPVPWATTLTSMPVLALNSGRMWPNRPESCVEVVDATTMDLSRAPTGPAAMRATVAAKNSRLRRIGMVLSSLCSSIEEWATAQTSNSPRMNRRASSVLGSPKNLSAAPLSITRPRCMSTISPARRLRPALERLEGWRNILGAPDFECVDLNAERAARGLNLPYLQHSGGIIAIANDRQPAEIGENFA